MRHWIKCTIRTLPLDSCTFTGKPKAERLKDAFLNLMSQEQTLAENVCVCACLYMCVVFIIFISSVLSHKYYKHYHKNRTFQILNAVHFTCLQIDIANSYHLLMPTGCQATKHFLYIFLVLLLNNPTRYLLLSPILPV